MLLLLPGLLLLTFSGAIALRPEPQADAFRDAERLWQAGRIAEARRAFDALDDSPVVHLRRAQIAVMRGECVVAQHAAAHALQLPLRRDEAALAHMIAGVCAARAGKDERAEAEWQAVDPHSPLRLLTHVLRGEIALRDGRSTDAARHYTAALESSPRDPWRSLIVTRLALVAPDESTERLASVPLSLSAATSDTRALLPIAPAAIVADAQQLRAILSQAEPQRAHLLGQFALDRELHRLALSYLERVPDDSPQALLARAQSAYARFMLGQVDAALGQFAELATGAPDDPAVATLYATLLVSRGDLEAASTALDVAESYHPLDPAIALARSEVLAARRDYGRAIAELRRARDIARPDARGRYAIALARFYLQTTHDVCGGGIAAAREATAIAPDAPESWQTLAATLYHCRAYHASADAARRGLAIAPDHAALQYYLGAAQWHSGATGAAQARLIKAADRDPAGEWRRRAEAMLGW